MISSESPSVAEVARWTRWFRIATAALRSGTQRDWGEGAGAKIDAGCDVEGWYRELPERVQKLYEETERKRKK